MIGQRQGVNKRRVMTGRRLVGIRRMRAAASSSRTLRRINNIICDSCYDAREYSSASVVIT